MGCLGCATYDPATAVSKSTTALLAMTAIDTTNLRITFTAPANGIVLVRMSTIVHGATTYPSILLGVLDGATVKKRVSPIGSLKTTAVATAQLAQEASFLVTGLTPGNSYTWDAAYAVQVLLASTGMKYGGPNNTTTNDAFGAFVFEIWDTHNLLAGVCYDPAVADSGDAGLIAMTVFDTTNLRLTFTAPLSGKVMVRMAATIHGATTMSSELWGVLDGSTVKLRVSPVGGLKNTALATAQVSQEICAVVAGLTPGQSYTWDAAHGREINVAASLVKWGGPNNASGDNAFGGFCYEIWKA